MPEPPKLDLTNVLREERKEKLSPVDKDFYEKAQKLIHELSTELERLDPESAKYQIQEDEFKKAKKNYNSILEIRMTKINYEASVHKSLKRQDEGEPENMTPEERDLYNGLYDLMYSFRNRYLDFFKTKTPDTAPVHVKKTAPNIQEYMIVRVLNDIPAFAGMDGRNYTLAKEDVATVPIVNANALILRGAAVQVMTTTKP